MTGWKAGLKALCYGKNAKRMKTEREAKKSANSFRNIKCDRRRMCGEANGER
jgi:hypothetical protein